MMFRAKPSRHLRQAYNVQISAFSALPQAQRGAILLLSLVLLAVLSLLGLSSLRGAITQEKIAINIQDRHLAVEGAESGLRFAEQQLSNNPPPVSDDAYYDTLAGESAPDTNVWDNTSGSSNMSYSVDHGAWGLSQPPAPQFKIERFAAPDKDFEIGAGETEQSSRVRSTTFYRILAYGQGKSSTSSAVIESIVIQQ